MQALTTIQVAKMLGISPGTLNNWRVLGFGPTFFRVGRAVRYQLKDVVDYINCHTIQGELNLHEAHENTKRTELA